VSGPPPAREEVLIRAAWVLTVGPEGDVPDGAVHVRDGEIVAVGPYPDLRAALPDVPVTGDGTGLLIPGFVNAHTHLSEALATGMGSELTLFEWGERLVGPLGSVLTEEDAREGTRLRAVEMLLSGVTTVNDMFVHCNAEEYASLGVVAGLESAGMRGVVSFGAEDVAAPGQPAWADVTRTPRSWSSTGTASGRCSGRATSCSKRAWTPAAATAGPCTPIWRRSARNSSPRRSGGGGGPSRTPCASACSNGR
jgi:hypothetical protein